MKMQLVVALAGCFALTGATITACTQESAPTTSEPLSGQALDQLLLAADGGPLSVDGGNSCATCIQRSCGSELTALGTELQTLHSQEVATFTCVRNSMCLSLYWTDRDAGASAARAAVTACIGACLVDSGLPGQDAAIGEVSALAGALDTCVDSSCTSQCPGAANDHDDRDGSPPRPLFDGSFPRWEGGFPHFDGSLPPFGAGPFGFSKGR
jgi:hypothetical protein